MIENCHVDTIELEISSRAYSKVHTSGSIDFSQLYHTVDVEISLKESEHYEASEHKKNWENRR